ncbi:MAG: CpsD/CapB family tyrosine-protein kinase, partial [Planctomycetota bacterium]|nr:CpsD/CapB family tyrosine-protein kinase [Planctomycetota bacterium]
SIIYTASCQCQAVPANKPDSPSVPLNIALGLVLGLFLGTGLAFVREATERPIVSSSQLERISGSPCLLNISKGKRESDATDSHRALRASVTHLAKEGGAKTLAIISSGADESTPTTSLGLARALAQSGERILLIEGDLSTPSLATALGVTTSSGLIDVLAGKSTIEAAISESEVENLSLLTRGSSSAASGDLLGSLRLRETLKSLGASYDRVLITTPDLSSSSDAISVAAASDSSLWFVQAGQVSEDAITESCKRMRMAGASILGCVLKTS